jgi:DNA/RNA-binding domain of Phe-tRNA-synthetase-like protein
MFLKYKILLAFLLLTGCARLTFDSAEFNQLITINENANKLVVTCGSPDQYEKIILLKDDINHFNRYESYRSGSRENVTEVSNELNTMVNELSSRYETNTPSIMYCTQKLQNIADGTNTILSAIGALQ